MAFLEPRKRLLLKMIIYGFCFGCVTYQAHICFLKYFSFPLGIELEYVDTKDVPISFTMCKVVHSANQNIGGRLFNDKITQLKELRVITKDGDILLYNGTFPLTYDFIASLQKIILCKEFKLPNKTISEVKVMHNAQDRDVNFHLFLHPTGMIQSQGLVYQYDNKIFHGYVDGFTEVKFETYDLTSSPKVSCKNLDFYNCRTKKIIEEYNATMGCAYPIQR